MCFGCARDKEQARVDFFLNANTLATLPLWGLDGQTGTGTGGVAVNIGPPVWYVEEGEGGGGREEKGEGRGGKGRGGEGRVKRRKHEGWRGWR